MDPVFLWVVRKEILTYKSNCIITLAQPLKKCEIYTYTLYTLLSRFLGTNFLFFTTPNLCMKIKVR